MRRWAMVSLLALLAQVSAQVPSAAALTAAVSAMSSPIYQRVNPTNQASLVTGWQDEATAAASVYGFTTDLGVPFHASLVAATGLGPVRRMWNATTIDFAWAVQGSTAMSRLTSAGYVDQGTNFYASVTDVPGETLAVNSYLKGNNRRLALEGTAGALTSAGWTLDYVAFYVPRTAVVPPPPVTPSTTAGSAPVGSTAYPVPAGAIHVSPSGSDSAAGSPVAPVRTIGRAIALVPSGGTVVLRGGTYRESVLIEGKTVTLQSYPNEAVWLDGSVPVTGWVGDGTTWRKDGWTARFDHSPTYTQGAPDSTKPYWQFVNTTTHPMAAHPDQVFIDGEPLVQVQKRSQVTAGTFFLDEVTSKLYIGTNPSAHAVDASTNYKAMTIRGGPSVVRGIGIRRFSPSVFHMGAITVEAPGVRFENVVIRDSSTTGISLQRTDISLDRMTILRSGMLGIHARYADRVKVLSVLSTENNSEHFNIAPVSGGAKLGSTRGVTIRNSSFSGNYGHGFWEDLSCYDSIITGSSFSDNVGTGLFLEISAKAVVADNLLARNQEFGIKVNNTSNVEVWNNTFVGNGRPLNIVQDNRRNTNPNDPAVDSRIAWPDPAMPWTLGPVTIRNNIVAESRTSANCLLCVEDYSHQMTAAQMGVTANGNVYQRSSSTSPTWLVVWSKGVGSPAVFTSLSAARSATGQEQRGREYVGSRIVDDATRLVPAVASVESQIAVGLPSGIASLVGRPVGTVHLGRW